MNVIVKTYRRLESVYRKKINVLFAELGFYTGYYRRARGSRIIVYHGICEKKPLRFNTLFVTCKTFEKHLQYYRRYCHLISLDDYYHKRFHPGKFNICISFDDGFAGAYRHALPLLEKYKVPAVFFITGIRHIGGDILWNDFLSLIIDNGPQQITINDKIFLKQKNKYREPATKITLNDYLRGKSFEEKKKWMDSMHQYAFFRNDVSLYDYWLQIGTEEIKQLSDSLLVTIGSHGYYHNDLVYDDAEMLAAELKSSKHFLESVTGKEISSIAFPYGSYSPRVIEAAVNAGYKQLLPERFLSDQDNRNPLLAERMGINPFIGPASQLRAIIKGNYA